MPNKKFSIFPISPFWGYGEINFLNNELFQLLANVSSLKVE